MIYRYFMIYPYILLHIDFFVTTIEWGFEAFTNFQQTLSHIVMSYIPRKKQ